MCVGRGPGIRRPKKFNSLSRISDRSDPDQLVNKLSGVSLINNASRAAIICSKVPGDPDNETTRHFMITGEAAIRVITGDPALRSVTPGINCLNRKQIKKSFVPARCLTTRNSGDPVSVGHYSCL